jgi:hypothetical protein
MVHETGRGLPQADKLVGKVLPTVTEYVSQESRQRPIEIDNLDEASYSWKAILTLYPNLERLRAKESMESLKELFTLLSTSPNVVPHLKYLEAHPVYAPPPTGVPDLGSGGDTNHGWKPWDILDLKDILASRVITNPVSLTVQYPNTNFLLNSQARSTTFCEYGVTHHLYLLTKV